MPAKPNNLISTKEAARLVGRSSDYVARLARAEKIVAEKIGGSWLVDRDSLLSFFDVQEKISEEKKEQLSSVRKEEYKNSQAVFPRAQKFIQTEVHHGIFTAHNLIALTASILLVFGGYMTVQAQPVQHAFSEIKEKAISGVYIVRRSIESAARAPELVSDLYEVQKTNYVVLDSPLPEIASSFSEVFAGMGFGAGELRARYVADASEITTPVSVTDVAASVFRNYKSVGVVLLDTGRSIQNVHLSLIEWTAQTVVGTAVAAKSSSDFVIDTYVSGVKTFTSVAQSYPENHVAGVYGFVNRTPQVARQVALVPYVVGDALVSAVGELPKAQERFAYGFAENAPKLVGEVAQSSLSFGAGVVDTSETITSSYRSGIEKVGEQIGETYLEARIVFPAYAEQNLRVAAVRTGSGIAAAFTPLVSEVQQMVANQVVGVIRIGQAVTDIKNEWIAGVVGTKNHVVTQVDGVELQGGVVSAVENFFARFFNRNQEPVLLVTSGAKTITQEEAASQPVRTSPVTNNFYSFQDTGITRSYVDANLAALRSYILAEIDSLDFVVERSDSDNYSNILDTLNDAVTGELAPSSIRTTGDITAGSFTGGTASFATTTITELTVTGDTTFSGTLTVGGLATTGALTAPYFTATSTTATSSFAGGLNVGSGAFVYDRNSGNVGVGTTSPFTDFAVSGDSYVSGDITSAGTVTGASGLFTGLIATNATATNATSTNFYTDIFRAATGVITTLTGTDAVFTNATSTTLDVSGNLRLPNLTPSRLVALTANGTLINSDLASWIAGTSNQVTVTDDGDGSVTLSLPSELSFTDFTAVNGTTTNATSTNLAIESLTSGRVPFATTGGRLIDSANLTFDDTTVTAPVFAASSASATSTFAGGLAVETSGLVYDYQTNRVGVGTATPTERFVVNETVDARVARFTGGSGSNDLGVVFESNGKEWTLWNTDNITGQGFGIYDDTLNQYRLVVDGTDGNIGIGTTDPQDKLHVSDASNPNIRQSRTGTGQVWVQTIDSSNRWLLREAASEGGTQFNRLQIDDDGETLLVPNGGNVGIGTSSPYAKLSVVGEAVAEFFTATSTSIASTFPLATFTSATSTNFYTSTFGINNEYISDLTGNALEISDGQLNVATTSLASGFFLQDGNSFGATAVLGTNDSNNLQFETGGSTRVTIDTSGNVGVGETVPQNVFHIVNSNPTIRLEDSDGTDATYAQIQANGQGDLTLRADPGNVSGSTHIGFELDGAEVGRFNAGGNFGVGTTTPWGQFSVEGQGGKPSFVVADSSNNTDFVVSESGNVGIGTEAPLSILDILSTTPQLRIRDTDTSNDTVHGELTFENSATALASIQGYRGSGSTQGELIFNTRQSGTLTEAMRINSAGNIGIGTTTIGSRLTLAVDSTDNILSLKRNDNAQTWAIDLSGNDFNIKDSTGGFTALTIANGTGRVGIGTSSPTDTLTIEGDGAAQIARFTDSSGATRLVLEEDGTVAFGINTPNATYYQFAAPDNTQAVTFSDLNGNYRHVFGTDASSNPYWRSFNNKTLSLGVNSDDALYVTYNANGSQPDVGIGTTSPWGAFAVDASGTDTGENIAVFASSTTIGLLIDSGGNVGVGTSDPEGIFHVVNTSSAATPNGSADDFVLEHTGSTGMSIISGDSGAGNIYFTDQSSSGSFRGAVRYDHSIDALELWEGGGERLTIIDTNVGIGTTTPQAKLSVSQGGVAIKLSDNSGSGDTALTYLQFADDNGVETGYIGDASTLDQSITISANDAVRIRAGGAERVTFSADGYLGIASTSPMLPLSIAGATTINNLTTNIALAGGAQGIQFLENGASEAGAITGFDGSINFWATDDITGGWNSAERAAIITNTREFGISTSTPWAQFSVEGQGSKPSFVVADSSNNTDFIVTEGGNVGVGSTTPSKKLAVAGGVRISPIFSGDGIFVDSGGSTMFSFTRQDGVNNADLGVNTYGGFGVAVGETTIYNTPSESYDFYVDPSGNVGIGTTTPNEKLTVLGGGDASAVIVGNGDALDTSYTLSVQNTGGTNDGAWIEILNGVEGAGAFLGIEDAGAAGAGDDDAVALYNYQGGPIRFYTHPSTSNAILRTIIDEDGNVGISTSTPWAQLSVEGQGSKPSFVVSDASNNTDFIVTESGSAGVGTVSPSELFEVYGGKISVDSAGATDTEYLEFSSGGTTIGGIGRDTNDIVLSSPFGIRLTENGTDVLTVAGGNVGIGTANVSSNLEVNHSGDDIYNIWLGDEDDITSNTGIYGRTTGIFSIGAAGGDIVLDTNQGSAERVRIKGDTGNVGISTSTPWAQFSVEGQGSKPSFVVADSSNNTDFIVTEGGNVGIGGTTNPTYKLQLSSGSIDVNANGQGYRFGAGDAEITHTGYDLQLKTYDGSSLTEKVRITSMGDVGIGITSPETLLHISSTSAPTIRFDLNDSTVNSSDTLGAIEFYTDDSTATEGISAKIEARALNSFAASQQSTGLAFYTSRVAADVGGVERMIIDEWGNVGIGNSAPDSITFPTDAGYSGTHENSRNLVIQGQTDGNGDGGVFLRRYDESVGLDLYYNGGAGAAYIDSRWTGDATGGLRFRTQTAGTPRDALTILGGGNVGIGTTTPNDRLVVADTAVGSSVATSGGTDPTQLGAIYATNIGAAGAGLHFGATNNDGTFWLQNRAAGDYSTNFDLSLNPNGGNVGIGTTTPESKLSTTGDLLVWDGSTNPGLFVDASTGKVSIGSRSVSETNNQLNIISPDTNFATVSLRNQVTGTGATQGTDFYTGSENFNIYNWDEDGGALIYVSNGDLAFNAASNGDVHLAQSFTVTSGGRIGLGDTSPDYQTEIVSSSGSGYFGITNSTDGDIFEIDSSGNVGIGTNSPDAKLHVQTGSDVNLEIGDDGSGISRLMSINDARSAYKELRFFGSPVTFYGNGTENFRVHTNGVVGVGTTTPGTSGFSGILDINRSSDNQNWIYGGNGANARFGIGTLTGGHVAFTSYNALDLRLGVGTADDITIESSGSVGIGTTSPSDFSSLVKLAIEGNDPRILLSDNGGTPRSSWSYRSADGNFIIRDETTGGGVDRVTVDSSGDTTFAGSGGTCVIDGSGACSSDERLKTNISEITGDEALDKLSRITSTRFTWTDTSWDQDPNVGLLAQEVLVEFPELVDTALTTFNGTEGEYYVLNYAGLTSPLIAGVNALNERTGGIYTDALDNVGIGTDAPEYKLHVLGDVAATSFVNISTRESKKGISYLDEARKDNILETIKAVGVAEYRYEYESDSNPLRLGLIAEEAPAEILSVSGKGVDIYKLATFTLVAVQQLALDVESLEDRVAVLEAQIAAGGSSEGGMFSTSTLQAVLSDLGVLIERGFAQFDKLAFRELVATQGDAGAAAAGSVTILEGNKVAEVENSQVLASSKVFVTFTSPLEGNWFIADKQSGSFRVELDRSQNEDVSFDYFIVQTERSRTVNTGDTEENGAPSHPGGAEPVITIIGDNPMTVIYDSEFVDPGAYVTDDKDTDITYDVYINGLREQVNRFNTRDVGEHEVMYHAIDKDGNVVSAVRTVYVVREDEEAPVSETPAEDPVVEEEPVEESDPVVEEIPVEEPVVDTVAPVVKLNGKAAIEVEVGAAFTDSGATATDDVDGDLTPDIVVSGAVDTSAVGVYTLTYTVSDTAGNESSVSRTVTVIEPVVEEAPAEEPAPESTEAPVEDVVE